MVRKMKSVAELGDELVAIYEAKGQTVSQNLMLGISPSEYAKAIGFEIEQIPSSVLKLYQWRNGCANEGAEALFLFRDNCFIRAERGKEELNMIRNIYGANSEDRFDLTRVIPIAAFEGSVFAVVTGKHNLGSRFEHPVVSIFEGIDLFFGSIESMLQTCIAWVGHPEWEPFNELPRDEELKIWRRLNPGVDLR
jgi:hypothetical protein